MMRNHGSVLGIFLALVIALVPARAAPEAPPIGVTPLRLSYVEGEVSFQRSGIADWTPARINTPLAAGDAFYTGSGANLEIQAGQRAFIRAGEQTYLSLGNREPDFIQFRVTGGRVSADLRSLPPGETLELDAPNAVFTVIHPGYYRLDVSEGRIQFVSRRGGRATVMLADGKSVEIMPNEEIVVEGADTPIVESYMAPESDAWDSWNLARTDHQADALSNRYLPAGVYGGDALDQYGNWRSVPSYGEVWVPDSVPVDWAPYSTGSWVWDPYYHWTWIDDSPWGWAPFHYGRWVFLDGFWAWAPGPVVAWPVYAPALVAFFSGTIGVNSLCWVPLGWGEPVVPWWGPRGFAGVTWWGGWGGPRLVNKVVNITNIQVFRNVSVPHAVVGMPMQRFGHEPVTVARLANIDPARLAPAHRTLPMRPTPGLGFAAVGHAPRPAEAVLERPVIATRVPHSMGTAPPGKTAEPTAALGPVHLVRPLRHGAMPTLARPPFGMQNAQERPRPEAPPRFVPINPAARPPTEEPGRSAGLAAPHPHAPSGSPSGSMPSGTAVAPHPGIQRAEPLPRPTMPGMGGGIQHPPAPRPEPLPHQAEERMPHPAAPHVESLPHPVQPRWEERAPALGRPLPGEPANRLFPGGGMPSPHGMAPPAPQAMPGPHPAPPPAPRPMAAPNPGGAGGHGGHGHGR